MIKRYIVAFAAILLLTLSMSGCSLNGKETIEENISKVTETDLNAKIHSICNLATVEVKYHNVAEKTKPAGKGMLAWGEKDRKFWIEYESTVKLGINASKVNASIDGDTVIITMPNAEILGEPSWDADNSKEYSSPDSLNSNDLTPEEKDDTINKGQENMKKEILEDDTLLVQAEDNAKKIIESFVEKMGTINGVDYTIKWKDAK